MRAVVENANRSWPQVAARDSKGIGKGSVLEKTAASVFFSSIIRSEHRFRSLGVFYLSFLRARSKRLDEKKPCSNFQRNRKDSLFAAKGFFFGLTELSFSSHAPHAPADGSAQAFLLLLNLPPLSRALPNHNTHRKNKNGGSSSQ